MTPRKPANHRKKALKPGDDPQREPVGLRIVGGRMRGRKLAYTGDLRTRPMKDRVREALFNLIGPAIVGTHAIDLFAGTGALGLEALSRGAARATFIEQHFPTAEVLRRNAEQLGVAADAEIVTASVFFWWRRGARPDGRPWAVFCSPPYELYVSQADDMRTLIEGLLAAAPPKSVLAVEADGRFDFSQLPDAPRWQVRHYLPAVVGVRHLAAG